MCYSSVLCFFFAIFTTSFAILFPCDHIQSGRTCYLRNITINPSDNHAMAEFQDVLQLVIESSQIPVFSTELFAALGESNFLTLKGGQVGSVNFSSEKLHSLRIHKTELRNFSISAVPNHSLNTLIINRNLLERLPDAIRYLVGLTILDLSQNRLEFVDLDWFQQMDNLLVLDLSRNQLIRIDGSSDVRLKRLKNFWVNHNYLSQIPWFPIGFPRLERIRLADNRWSCGWVGSMRQQIWNRKIRLFDSDGACEERNDGGLCCYDEDAKPYQPRYELIEIDEGSRQDGPLVEKLTQQESELGDQQPRSNDSCQVLEAKVRLLQRETVRLAMEKAEMEQQFVKKVTSMQDILRAMREDLDESEREVSKYRYKERLQMIAKTDQVEREENN
uniref:Putative leucine-rich repeat protein n=1 Tax=Culex tarsalis TaxID=7177 RepID=A0A1Q3FR55_CULTA